MTPRRVTIAIPIHNEAEVIGFISLMASPTSSSQLGTWKVVLATRD